MQPIRVPSSFDGHHPPEPELISDCVHCGFCLPSCPTYVLFNEEMDSPRGRIYLMAEAHEGEAISKSMVGHWDRCLGCLACVTACPSGVKYGTLIEETRQQVERVYKRGRWDRTFRRLIYSLFPYPNRLRRMLPLFRLYQQRGIRDRVRRSGVLRLMPKRLQSMEALLPPVPATQQPIREHTEAKGTEKRKAALVTGCIQRAFFPHVNAATIRVLSADGYAVWAPTAQGCCGALSMHGGRESEALEFARGLMDALGGSEVDVIVANVSGCGAAMKEYGYWLRDDPEYADRAREFSARVRDVSEALVEVGPTAQRHPLNVRAVYHDACHLLHGQSVAGQPRALLEQIPDLELVEMPAERTMCCGSAGTYNLLEPDAAAELGARKARHAIAAAADVLVAGNPGCLLQIEANLMKAGKSLPTAHLVEVLDASIRGEQLA